MNPRALRGVLLAGLLFLVVHVGAVSLAPTFEAAGYQTVEDPQNPTNSALYLGAILVVTALMLAAFKYDFDWAVRLVIVGSSGLLSWYVFSVYLPGAVAVAASALVAVALLAYPEWYVIDSAGALMGAGAAGLFGISFGLLPAIVLLTVLAVYDAISVYGTEHMLDLADGVLDLNIPVVLVIPLEWSYSLLEEGSTEGATEGTDEAERDVFFIGLGDAVMPAVMAASAAFWLPQQAFGLPYVPALGLPALTSIVGTFVGLAVLLRMVLKGRPHAGLPLLNGGAIGGYLLGALVAGVPLAQALGVARYL
ncbi:presenilin family intramembrane aspartyl protease PSH [Halobaculum lipolyticum]|uniref:Presenilin family intramembrane aspartyl protease PSH n=1 Tax=Halobaculum lipolyticum TaxID=3032001 RepID=A0ABD5W920_9EURY|nr:presenilin family intramembrane aspartyl protease PSH [Halobaculum sp. DT31]